MKQNVKKAILVIALPCITLIVFYLFICIKQAESTTFVALKARSRAVVECLNEGNSIGVGLWPRDDSTQAHYRSCVDYFNWLKTMVSSSRGEYDKKCLNYLREELVSQLYGRQCFTEKNMPWNIIKNLPEDAPDNLIVMTTANVNPTSLRTRLSDRDMYKRIEVVQNSPVRVLRERICLVRKDGKVVELWIGRSPQAKFTYREVYDNIPFDLTTNLVNGMPVKYLTPTGEITPTNE